MVINVHFLAEDGKKKIGHLKDDFSYKDFIDMFNGLYGPNSHTMYMLVAKSKELCADDEDKFKERKKLITNSVNIFVGRRMHGGHY
ncbi:unnamed protein product [Rotaria magnacalcarata]|uniref:Uncharacterized protein n=1 Tax=Rotaria magnacalcarata TaxID=392030 RepID=A0A819H974_9BILA|nr:unnamed protein product [Rotaria magnacalcarata]